MKHGRDEEIEKMTEDWLRQNDPQYRSRYKNYTTDEQINKKSKKEIPISNLSKGDRQKLENQYYSQKRGDDNNE